MEEEVWEFLEKHIVPVLTMASATTTDREVATSGANVPNADLHAYLTELFVCLKKVTSTEVC